MRLAEIVSELYERPLTAAERTQMDNLQTKFKINDADPLIVVLAMMSANAQTVGNAPELVGKKMEETIALHKTVLEDQAVLISKNLIVTIAKQLKETSLTLNSGRSRMTYVLAGAIPGVIIGATLFAALRHYLL